MGVTKLIGINLMSYKFTREMRGKGGYQWYIPTGMDINKHEVRQIKRFTKKLKGANFICGELYFWFVYVLFHYYIVKFQS